jgi:hypothetical protein
VGGLTGQEAAATPESYESVEIKQKRLGKAHLLVPVIFLTPRSYSDLFFFILKGILFKLTWAF